MDPDSDEVVFEAPEHFRIYKSGRIDRFHRPVLVAAGVDDDASGVATKDVVLDDATGLTVRLFLPKRQEPSGKKLPVLVYFHGGGFILESAKSATYHNYLTSLAAAAGVRRLPPRPRAPAPRGLRRLLDRAPVGGVRAGRLARRARRRVPRLRRRRQRRRQHSAQRAGEGVVCGKRGEDRGRGPAPPVLRRKHGHRGGAGARGRDHRQGVGVRVPGRGRRRGRPEDQPDRAGRAGAGAPRVRADAGVHGGEGLAGGEGPRVLRRRGGERVARERGVAGDGRGGARVLPAEARVRQGQGAHGPRRGVHRRSMMSCSTFMEEEQLSFDGTTTAQNSNGASWVSGYQQWPWFPCIHKKN